jgi:hypothetical protein
MNNEKAAKLKKMLQLDNLPRIYFARLIGISAYTIYFIFYDTRRPYVSITSMEAHKREFPAVTPFNGKGRLSLTLLRPIEEFRGTFSGSLFVRIDLSGRLGNRKLYYRESKEGIVFVEDMKLKDFKTAAAISAFTQRHKQIRKTFLVGNQIKYTRLMNCLTDQKNDWVLFEWLSIATPNTQQKKEADPFKNFSLINDPSKLYELKIRIDGFFTWLLGTLPDGQAVSKKDLLDSMEICSIKVWSSSPAFHWQGHNYNMSQLDASIYPTNIAPQRWNQPHLHGENAFLDKHLAILFMNIEFYAQQMAQMLNKKLRANNII